MFGNYSCGGGYQGQTKVRRTRKTATDSMNHAAPLWIGCVSKAALTGPYPVGNIGARLRAWSVNELPREDTEIWPTSLRLGDRFP